MPPARVLVIEDEIELAELVCAVLDMHGFETRSAPDGPQGLATAREWKPDLVVLDLMLPGIDGFEICQTLRNDRPQQPPGILMLTGLHRFAERFRGFQVGADRFLTKPFQADEIVSELNSLLEEYSQRPGQGLRREINLDSQNPAGLQAAVQALMSALVRATPLAPEEIQAMGQGIAQVRDAVSQWPAMHPEQGNWHVSVRIFRDRVETSIEGRGFDSGNHPATIPLQDLFQQAGVDHNVALPAALGDEVAFPDHGAVAVLTRRFSELNA